MSRVPRPLVDEVLVVDDGSRDRSAEVARAAGATVLAMGAVCGVGAALRRGYRHGLEHRFDALVVIAGNNKDSPEEIPLLLDPIADGRADLVQARASSRRTPTSARCPTTGAWRRACTRCSSPWSPAAA